MLTLITEKQSQTDNTPLPIPEDELISLEEFKKNFEEVILEDLVITMVL